MSHENSLGDLCRQIDVHLGRYWRCLGPSVQVCASSPCGKYHVLTMPALETLTKGS